MGKTLTEVMFEATAPYNNPYQGQDKKVVFVCSAGILRSATGARMYAGKFNTRAAGSHDEYALVPLTENLLAWADEVVFVNEENYKRACQKWDMDSWGDKVKVLNIPDQHAHMAPALQQAFLDQYGPNT